MKISLICTAFLILYFLCSCQSRPDQEKQSPGGSNRSSKLKLSDFEKFMEKNSSSILANSFFNAVQHSYYSHPKDTVLAEFGDEEVMATHSKSIWQLKFNESRYTSLTIQYWTDVNLQGSLEDFLHPYSESENLNGALFLRVGRVYCSIYLSEGGGASNTYLCHLQNLLFQNYLELFCD